jgi:outer membrane protein W
MKISRLFIFVYVLVANICFSAVSQAQSISMGIRGGGNYSKLLGIDSAEFKTGIAGGITVNYQTQGKWSVSADFLYTQRGTTFQRNFSDVITNQTEKYEYDYSFNYIEIPVLFHYNFLSDSSKLKARAFFGPSLNVRVNANNKIKYTKVINYGDSSVTTNSEGEQDLAYIYTPLDYGFVGGIGATYAITDKISASVDIRGSYGLLDIREYLSESSNAVRNANINVLLGVTYRLSK